MHSVSDGWTLSLLKLDVTALWGALSNYCPRHSPAAAFQSSVGKQPFLLIVFSVFCNICGSGTA